MTEEVKKDSVKKSDGAEAKVTVTKELVEMVEESVAKAVEGAIKAKKELRFHGTKQAESKATKADKKVELNTYVKSLMISKDSEEYGEAMKVIKNAHIARAKTITGSVDANGGFLVPTVFETPILETFDTYDEVTRLYNMVDFNRPGKVFNLNELSSRVQVYRGVGENYNGTASTPTFTEPQIAIDNYFGATTITEDFMEDTETDIMSSLRQQYGEQFNKVWQNTTINSTITVSGVVSNGFFVKGNGATTVTGTTGSYTSLQAEDLEKLYFTAISIDSYQDSNKNNGVFVMHPLTLQALRSNIRSAGNQNDFISLFNNEVEMTILGRPVITTNQAPTPATTTSDPYVFYGDLSKHVQARRKRGLTMKINDQGTTLDGRNLNYQLGRELVLTMRVGAQITETIGMTHLITS